MPVQEFGRKKLKKQEIVAPEGLKIVADFKSPEGVCAGPPVHLPISATPEQLQLLLNHILKNEDPLPYSFSVNDTEITTDIFMDVIHKMKRSAEDSLTIVYQPQAVFKVRTVSRCTASLDGHAEAILSVQFSPDGKRLASGSGDCTVRVWDLNTETPQHTLSGHKNYVTHVAWSPDSQLLISGSMDSTIIVWDPKAGKMNGTPIRGHSQVITSLAWEPMHCNQTCNRFVSSSKDGTAKIWDAVQRKMLFTLAGHTGPVMCVRWGGEGLIYTGSRDKTIKVWSGETGKLVKTLEGHGHWVNHLALSTDFVLRTGPHDHTSKIFASKEEAFKAACERYQATLAEGGGIERLASGSDDFTIFLWEPTVNKKSIARMTGHQQPVNHLSFSPNGRLLASASFDKSVKLWDSKTGA